MTVLRSGSASDVGRVRNVNQDLPLERPNLYAVADGMGGHVGGEVAARVAVETLEQAFDRTPTVEGLLEAFSEANAAVWHESQVNADLRGMGTTLTAVALVGGTEGGDVLALANVGDSRAYLFSGGAITQVTDDHSLAEERMRQGEMTEEEAAVHPQRHILTRALGVSSQVEADMWELELRTGDRLLLCSDGLTNEVGSDEMAAILGEVEDPAEAAQRLVDAANGHGGADNITVVVVDVQVGEEGDGIESRVIPLSLGVASLADPLASTAAVPLVEPPPEGDPGRGRPGPRARFRTRGRWRLVVLRCDRGRPGGRPGRDPGARFPPRLRRRARHAGRDRSAQRRVLRGRGGRSRPGGPFDGPGAAASGQAGWRQAGGQGEPRGAPAPAGHPTPHHAAGARLRDPGGRRAGSGLLRPQVVRLRQLDRDRAG